MYDLTDILKKYKVSDKDIPSLLKEINEFIEETCSIDYYDEGYQFGYDEGYTEGRSDGYDEGKSEEE